MNIRQNSFLSVLTDKLYHTPVVVVVDVLVAVVVVAVLLAVDRRLTRDAKHFYCRSSKCLNIPHRHKGSSFIKGSVPLRCSVF